MHLRRTGKRTAPITIYYIYIYIYIYLQLTLSRQPPCAAPLHHCWRQSGREMHVNHSNCRCVINQSGHSDVPWPSLSQAGSLCKLTLPLLCGVVWCGDVFGGRRNGKRERIATMLIDDRQSRTGTRLRVVVVFMKLKRHVVQGRHRHAPPTKCLAAVAFLR